MIVGANRDKVINNIREAAQDRDFYRKVEVDDPDLTQQERFDLISRHLGQKHTLGLLLWNLAARVITWILTKSQNIHTRIEGLDYIKGIQGGAIITSNHFSPLDNTVVRQTVIKAFHERLYIVSQDTNLAMKGLIGFLMNYSDIIPISPNVRYMNDYFGPAVKEMLEEGEKILIYPEQEMWFNYRKPRPPKRGAYYYAASNCVPVLSFFVEIKTLPKKEREDFYKTEFVMHVLPPIYPDPEKTVAQNSRAMMNIDYQQKKEAYEKAYGRPLTYDFERGDIAGWVPYERDIK